MTQKFPPFSGVDMIRITKFARYLPEFGWQPIVLTARNSESELDARDTEILAELPENLEIHRVLCPSLHQLSRLLGLRVTQGSLAHADSGVYSRVRALFVPDLYVGWYFTAVRRARRIFRARRIDLVFSTSPRETSHLIARSLHRQYGCPWIADFRDPWTDKFTRPKRIPMLDRFDRRLERVVLEEANRILIAWPGIADGFKCVNCTIGDKLEYLSNGFDENDFTALKPRTFDRFTIVYAGKFHRMLTPEPIFEALAKLHTTVPELDRKLQLLLVGRQDPYTKRLIGTFRLESIVQPVAQVTHAESLRYISGADMLLLSISEHDPRHISSKFFEYLRANRPILLLSSANSAIIEIVRRLKLDRCIVSRSPDVLAAQIKTSLKESAQRRPNIAKTNHDLVEFERRHLTERLAVIFDAELHHR